MDKKVLIGAVFHWHSFLHIGSHHYAKQFARNGYKVAYISNPISPFHYIFAKDKEVLKEKFNLWYRGGELVEDGKIWAYVPFTLLPIQNWPVLRSKWIMNNSHRFTVPHINSTLRKNNFKQVDIIFLDGVFDYFLNMVTYKKSIWRIHDDISYLYNKGYENLLEKVKEFIHKVDLVAVVSRLLEITAKEMGAKKVLYLPNAVDFDHFNLGSNILPLEYNNIPSPRVIYVGTISYWFDVDLVFYAASKLKNISFILIGKPMIDLSKLTLLSNVYILGERRHALLPQYIKNVDVGIMPFKISQRIRSSSSNKLYEYIACGLPVVSTWWQELEDIKSPAYLASNYEEFVKLLVNALNEKDRSRYIEFAKANSWEDRFEKLMKALYSDEAV